MANETEFVRTSAEEDPNQNQMEPRCPLATAAMEEPQPVVLLTRLSPNDIRDQQHDVVSLSGSSDDEMSFRHPKGVNRNVFALSSEDSSDESTTIETSLDLSSDEYSADSGERRSKRSRSNSSISSRYRGPWYPLEESISEAESVGTERRNSGVSHGVEPSHASFSRRGSLFRERRNQPPGFAVPSRILPPARSNDVIVRQAVGMANLEADLRRKDAKIAALEETVATIKNSDCSFDAKLRAAFLKEKELKLDERRFVLQQNQLFLKPHSNHWKTGFHTAFRCSFKPSRTNIDRVYGILKDRFPSAKGKGIHES